ncbi:methyltransferase [Salinibacterium sp. G-O1]|uniref:class I SAM-dependent methyltransferase n=1 Tax=Salinibacterium sp. G-O1 TaxID=3046208 RepID=UPI0024B88CE2|nr:class I SAM-dependent methyltransferase [Salinibacterium sp. G-O1]MDJ0333755.1 methyltransferase [Salinibacterium sp. G-O1]
MSELEFDSLRRWPDLESPDLRAWDTADTLILDEAGARLRGAVVVIGDEYGALTLGALGRGATHVRVHQDRLSGELALHANSEGSFEGSFESLPLTPELVDGATLVLLRLPRSLDALDEIAALIARHASPDVVVVAGGRIKHMTVTMNEVLRRHFGTVDVTHARQKSRGLIARQPLTGTLTEPRRKFHADLGLWVVATGGVFAGTSIDIGTRALLGSLDRVAPFESAVDLGCGTGILAAALARQNPTASVLATDESAAAVASATLTALANDLAVTVTVTRDDAASTVAKRSVDLVVLNPPFHTGAAVHSGVSTKLFEAATRMLRPGGELWTVFNSHLDYRPTLERIIGGTRQIERTPKFTVTLSRKR